MRVQRGPRQEDELSSSVQSQSSNDSTPYRSPARSPPSPPSFRSAMSRRESTPLLGTASPLLGTASPLLGTGSPCYNYKALDNEDSDSLGPADLSSGEILKSLNRFEEKPEPNKQSSLVTIFSVWNTIMGSSLLTMAWGVEQAGLSIALILMVVMSALCLYTAYVLLEVNRHHGSWWCEVPTLCRRLLGRAAETLAHGFSLIVLMGANVVYWLLIANFMYYTVNYFVDLSTSNATYTASPSPLCLNASTPPAPSPWYWQPQSTVPLYVAIIIFPLLNFRSVTFFTKFNSLGTLSVVYLLIFVAVKGWLWGINVFPLPPAAPARHAAALSGMLALSFYIHNIIITIMSSNRNQENNGRDLTIAFVLVTLTYILVGAVFYVCFPLPKACIEDNILNNFEMHDVMTAVARILLLFQVITVYPLVAYMLRTEATLLLPVKDSTCLMVTINIAIVTVCILVACFCPNIGTIIRYTGAVSGLVHVFALPSLLQLRSLQLRGELTWWKTVFYTLIMVFGAVNLMMQFFINE